MSHATPAGRARQVGQLRRRLGYAPALPFAELLCGSRKPRRPAGSTQKGPVSACPYRKRHDGIRRPFGWGADLSALAVSSLM
jgi:hypothetical protein